MCMKLQALLSVIALSGLCAISFAQRPPTVVKPGFSRGQAGGPPRAPLTDINGGLLRVPAVQKELHLTPQQITQITALFPQPPAGGPGGPRTGGPGGGDRRAQMQAAGQKAIGMLNANQKSRLKQLTLQVYGPTAFMISSIQHALGLSAGQISKIQAEAQKVSGERQAAFASMGQTRPGQGNPGDPATQQRMNQFRATMEKFRNEEMSADMKVLNSSQQSKWHAMLGKPFDVSQLRRGRGGFGGGGGRGGRGGGGARSIS